MGAADNEVSDPSDWIDTSLSSLSTLDTALRCQVCKEFFDTPMITSCSHTFCSLCIRRCLSSDGKCPTCRSEDQSSKLRRNWTVQECVDAFTVSRKATLELAKRNHDDDHPKRKRRKVDTRNDASPASELTSARRTRSSARISGQASTTASQEVIALDSEDDEGDDDFVSVQQQSVPVPDDGLVACPMCNKRMKEEAVFPHLDRCNGQQVKESPPPLLPQPSLPAQSAQHRIAPAARHLPHLNYSLLKDNPLKKKLQELGIPSWGSRQLLIRRHTQWIDIYNANSDSPKPRSNRELLRDLDVWEKTQGGHAPGQGQTGPVGVMRKDFDGTEWTGRHKNQFDDLVAQARARRKTAASTTAERKEEQKFGDAMEDVTATAPAAPASAAKDTTSPHTENPPKLNTSVDAIGTAISDAISSSPVASMLHSAAQDVRRRSSISGISSVAGISGLISTHSIPSTASTPAMSSSQTPRLNGASPSPKPGNSSLERDRKLSLQSSCPSETSLPEKLGTETQGVKRMPMFQVPANPVNDVEGLEAADKDG